MSALAEGRSHVPYRDSKLTRLLQNCLGGSARTAVVVTVVPGEDPHGETLNALRFASRASRVSVVAKISQHKNYEALYKETVSKLKTLEHLNVQNSGDAFVSREEVRRRDEQLEKQRLEMDGLRQQLQALQRENELLKLSTNNQQ